MAVAVVLMAVALVVVAVALVVVVEALVVVVVVAMVLVAMALVVVVVALVLVVVALVVVVVAVALVVVVVALVVVVVALLVVVMALVVVVVVALVVVVVALVVVAIVLVVVAVVLVAVVMAAVAVILVVMAMLVAVVAGGWRNLSRACWVLDACSLQPGAPASPEGLVGRVASCALGPGGTAGQGSRDRGEATTAVPWEGDFQPVGELLATRTVVVVTVGLRGLGVAAREAAARVRAGSQAALSPFASWPFLGVLGDPVSMGMAACCPRAPPGTREPGGLALACWAAWVRLTDSPVPGCGGFNLQGEEQAVAAAPRLTPPQSTDPRRAALRSASHASILSSRRAAKSLMECGQASHPHT